MENNINKIFKRRTCLSAAELDGYARNTLKPRERNQVERHLLDCELCSEALEGFIESGKDISLIQMKANLANRFVSKNSAQNSDVKKTYGWIWAAAAIVCVVLVSGIVWKFNQKQNNELADVQVKDSVQESAETLTLSGKELKAAAESPVPVAEPEAGESIKRQGGLNEVSSADKAVAASAVNNEVSRKNEENVHVFGLSDIAVAEEKRQDPQALARENYSNASTPSSGDNDVTLSDRSEMKKKSAAAAGLTEAERELAVSWKEIFKLAENGQYQKALLAVDQLQHEKDILKKAYYEGFYLYKLERYDEAILQFEKLKKDKSHPNHNDAEFYRALSLISTGRNKEGREILTRIVKEKLPHHEHAAETLRLLD